MKLNQATTAAAVFLSANVASSSSAAASSSSHDKLKDTIASLLSYRPHHYLRSHRMLTSDECLAYLFDDESYPTYSNAIDACDSETDVGDTTIFDYDGCDLSNITEACTADNRTIVADKWGDIGMNCTFLHKHDDSQTNERESFQFIYKESFECIPASCVSEWESGEGHMSDEFQKALERYIQELLEVSDVECNVNSVSADSLAVGDGETSSVGFSADEDTGATESLALASSAGKATGMLTLAATAAAAALVSF